MKRLLLAVMLLGAVATFAQKTIKVKTAEDFLKAIGPNRTIVIDTEEPLDITSVIKHYFNLNRITDNDFYYWRGEKMAHELPDVDPDEDAGDYGEEEGVYPDEGDMEEELNEDDYKYMELVQFKPENLKPEVYKAKSNGKPMQYAHIVYGSDGMGLEINDCENLTIKAGGSRAVLLARPRYVNVLEFTHCQNIKLENLVLGHTLEGYCDNGVLRLNTCTNAEITGCDLFGCGTEGFTFDFSSNISVSNSNVHDCSYHTMHLNGSEHVAFENCKFYRNKQFEQINSEESIGITFKNCEFKDLQGKLFNLQNKVEFIGCTFSNCQMQPITSANEEQDNAILTNCKQQ